MRSCSSLEESFHRGTVPSRNCTGAVRPRSTGDPEDAILIKRDTVVVGEVVRARRVHWGFTHRQPRLAFRFRYTTAVNGQAITLRSTPARLRDVDDDQIVVQQGRDGHALLWTGGAILFDAYVDGNYEV